MWVSVEVETTGADDSVFRRLSKASTAVASASLRGREVAEVPAQDKSSDAKCQQTRWNKPRGFLFPQLYLHSEAMLKVIEIQIVVRAEESTEDKVGVCFQLSSRESCGVKSDRSQPKSL